MAAFPKLKIDVKEIRELAEASDGDGVAPSRYDFGRSDGENQSNLFLFSIRTGRAERVGSALIRDARMPNFTDENRHRISPSSSDGRSNRNQKSPVSAPMRRDKICKDR